jgi:recombination protein RecA
MAIKVRPRLKPSAASSFSLDGSELGAVVGQIRQSYGEDVARVVSKQRRFEPRIRTGAFALDLALAGGFLRSRGSMLYGERSSGKSTTAMLTCINAQRMYPDEACAWIDLEGTFDEIWFEKLGGDLDRLLKVEPETGEQAVDMADAIARSKETSVIVTDSIAMLTPMKELDASSEDSLPGIHARLIGNYLRKLNNAMLKERHRGHKPLILHINQFRMKIGLAFGDPRTLPGGKALEFCTSQQVEMRNKEHVEKNGDISYNEHNFKITKDKTGGRYREGMFKLVRSPEYNDNLPEGYIDQVKSIIAAGERIGLVTGRYEISGFGKAPSAAEWQAKFLADAEMYLRVQNMVIDGYRKLWGLPTAEDEGLVGYGRPNR